MYNSSKKIYLIDTCLARILGFRATADNGRMMENAVFLKLKLNNDEIYFHKGQRECDFVIRKNGKINQAIQVTTELLSNKEREIDGLIEALNE